ncbi:hypothetical protein [Streptomyces ficellus]|uniref:Uncharacterized protein n=1 Tax=Streptomyces ficellus TaxID=1977088 RepID=A0A6I6F756_9ACTN|nr:hypothetical protein [Streptomyces ficellus]QGV76837.1 hypothetical protein EIZ62_00015 [Streptomyces ficellus]
MGVLQLEDLVDGGLEGVGVFRVQVSGGRHGRRRAGTVAHLPLERQPQRVAEGQLAFRDVWEGVVLAGRRHGVDGGIREQRSGESFLAQFADLRRRPGTADDEPAAHRIELLADITDAAHSSLQQHPPLQLHR